MIPKKINNKAFLSYRDKAEYILELSKQEELYAPMFDIVEEMMNSSTKNYNNISYINKLYFLSNAQYIEALGKQYEADGRIRIGLNFLKFILKKKYVILKEELFARYNINFDKIEFLEIEQETYALINGEKIKVNKYEGHVYAIYYKSILLDSDNLNTIIDYIGEIIERRITDGIINRRI